MLGVLSNSFPACDNALSNAQNILIVSTLCSLSNVCAFYESTLLFCFFSFLFSSPPPLPLMKFGWYIGINATVCPSVQILLGRYLLYWSTFLTKHDMVVCYHSTECHAEIWWCVIKRQSVMQICWFATSKVKVTSFHCIV